MSQETQQPSAEALALPAGSPFIESLNASVKIWKRFGPHIVDCAKCEEIARIIDAEFAALRAENEASKKPLEVIQHAHAEISGAYLDRTKELCDLRARLERAEELLAKSVDEMDHAHKSGASIWCPDWHHVKSCREFLSAPSAKPGEGEK